MISRDYVSLFNHDKVKKKCKLNHQKSGNIYIQYKQDTMVEKKMEHSEDKWKL